MTNSIVDHKMRLKMKEVEILLQGNIIIADRYETGPSRLYLRADKNYGTKRPDYLVSDLSYDEMMLFLDKLLEFLSVYLKKEES